MTQFDKPEQILKSLGVTEPHEIDLEAIAWTQGASIRYRHLDGCEARIIGYGDKAIITVNDQNPHRRQRFSIAHELGHWHLHRGERLICRADENASVTGVSNIVSDIEQAADKFAANLLIPRYLLRSMNASLSQMTFKTITAIAENFDVSLTAAAIQLVEMDYVPSLLICHGSQGRKWFKRSRSVPEHWFPQNKLDRESYAFGVLFEDRSDEGRPCCMDADLWFDCKGADLYQLTEETFRIGRDEVLILLVITDEDMLEERARR